MAEHLHTPAPWWADSMVPGIGSPIRTNVRDHEVVGIMHTIADSWLVQAAPELLEACLNAQNILTLFGDDSGTLEQVLAAIAKARGVEPDHDPPDSRNHMAKPYDDALIGHLRNNPPRNE